MALRKASPQPVGSITSVAGTPGTIVLMPCSHTSQPCAPSVTIDAAQVRTRHGLDRSASALGQHLRLVVVDRDPGGALDEGAQLRAVEHRQPLARIEDEGHRRRGELLGVLEHGRAPVGGDDGDAQVGASWHRGFVRPLHGARVKGGDLVVLAVGDDEGLRRERIGHGAHVLGAGTPGAQPGEVAVAVAADGRQHDRFAAERGEVVGDVAGAAAELATQGRHQERHVEDVQLVGQDLIGEAAAEIGDAVEGERSTDEGGHAVSREGARFRDRRSRPCSRRPKASRR